MATPQIEIGEVRDVLLFAFTDNAPQVESMLEGLAIREQQSIPVVCMSIRDEAGSTMVHYAAKRGHVAMLDRILSHFHAYRPDLIKSFINFKQSEGDTALHWAAKGGNRYYCEVLLESGIEVDVKNNDGKMAVDLARTAMGAKEPALAAARARHDAEKEKEKEKDEARLSQYAAEVARLTTLEEKLSGTVTYLDEKLRASQRSRT
ncbi:Uu.00g035630.m01.CDS01 [Anthostomella pinea]|uniref:Uu.00g035630.m01.CDS01 n=1 Tax=Anthostomella pinea TaxID=933095 RepID=A0AAI8VA97_9PEZI|nr:Uu.00g035630.m01.CDS01 [Anthostomella pinea]